MKDSRIEQAKKLLQESLSAQQVGLDRVRSADPDKAAGYSEVLDLIAKQRGANLWYPYLGSGRGKGPFVELLDGSVKYDFIAGIGVHHLGHGHPSLLSASIDAALSDIVMQGHLQQNQDQAELIDLLVRESGLDHCFLTTSGSMANDNALKIALQKNRPAKRIFAFERAFCGRSWAMSQLTEKAAVREGISVEMQVDFIPFFDSADPEGSTQRAIDQLKKHLWRHPKDYALMIFEMIQGEGGYYAGSASFFRALMNLLKEHHVAIHVDEVQTFGRTSRLFAFQHYGLQDLVDIVTIGKLSHVCATLFTHEYNPKPGLLSQTFSSSTSAICAAKEILRVLVQEGFFGENGKNMTFHKEIVSRFEAMKVRLPEAIQGPYGLGAMVAFTPLGGDAERVTQFAKTLFQNGVIGFICGKNPTRMRFLPPVSVVEPHHLDEVAGIIEKTLRVC